MKKINFIYAIVITCIGQSLFAEKFIIVNHLDRPISYMVATEDFRTQQGTIPANKESSLIDIQSKLMFISWNFGGRQHYQASFKGQIPLQTNKKNFFNIYPNGKYMHNFLGYKQEGIAE